MFRSKTTQREWLVEDLAQIRRYFPGATLIEPLDTPFDIEIGEEAMPFRGENDGTTSRAEDTGSALKRLCHSHEAGDPVKNPSQSNTTPTFDSYLMVLSSGGVL